MLVSSMGSRRGGVEVEAAVALQDPAVQGLQSPARLEAELDGVAAAIEATGWIRG